MISVALYRTLKEILRLLFCIVKIAANFVTDNKFSTNSSQNDKTWFKLLK